MDTDICGIPRLFGLPRAYRAEPLSDGHINDTYEVFTDSGRYILQAVNCCVFEDTKLLSRNILRASRAVSAYGGICAPVYLTTEEGPLCRYDGKVWRMWEYISAERETSVYDAGYAFGSFIRALDGDEPYVCAVKGFHDTRGVIDRARAEGITPLLDEAEIFEGVPLRNIHGDAKTGNCICAAKTAVIDIDTVMTHYAAYDYGDIVRSVCRNGLDDFDEVTRGFAAGTGGVLSEAEVGSLYSGIICVTGELALRYMLSACGKENLGASRTHCMHRAEELNKQLSLFRENEMYIRKSIETFFKG